VTKIVVMAKLQERAEWKKALFKDPERLARKLSKNQVEGISGESGDSRLFRYSIREAKDSGRTNLSGLVNRKERMRRRNMRSPIKTKTLRIRPAGRSTAAIMTMRALRLDAIRQKGKILAATVA
jgi:hypothetical protein